MNAKSGTKVRWLVSAGTAAVVVTSAALLFRAPAAGPRPAVEPARKPAIKLSPGRPDELAMRDLAPLFLPTRFNAAPSELRQLEPGRSFFERDAERWQFAEATPDLKLPAPVRPPSGPLDALADTPGALTLGLGRTDATIEPAPASGGHVDVYSAEAQNSLLSVALAPDARPVTGAGRDAPAWHPLEFTAAVDETGLVGPLLLTTGSGIEDVDNHFRNYLARRFRIGERLPPGFYRIVVGP